GRWPSSWWLAGWSAGRPYRPHCLVWWPVGRGLVGRPPSDRPADFLGWLGSDVRPPFWPADRPGWLWPDCRPVVLCWPAVSGRPPDLAGQPVGLGWSLRPIGRP